MKIKLLLAIAIPVLVLGYSFIFFLTTFGTEEKAEAEPAGEVAKAPASPAAEEAPEPAEVEEEPQETQDTPEERTEEDDKLSKQIAEDFSKAYYTYDANNPLQYAENSREYTSESFYKQMIEAPRRNTLEAVKTKVKELDTYPVDGGNAEKITWNVIITGEATANDGTKSIEEKWYWVLLEKENGKWVVKGVKVDGRTAS